LSNYLYISLAMPTAGGYMIGLFGELCWLWIKRMSWTQVIFVCLFIAAWAIFQLSSGCYHYRWQGCKRLMLHSWLLAVRVLFRATPTATRDLGLYGLIRRTVTHVPQRDSNRERPLLLRSNHSATRAAEHK
jgi:hypothetical protein